MGWRSICSALSLHSRVGVLVATPGAAVGVQMRKSFVRKREGGADAQNGDGETDSPRSEFAPGAGYAVPFPAVSGDELAAALECAGFRAALCTDEAMVVERSERRVCIPRVPVLDRESIEAVLRAAEIGIVRCLELLDCLTRGEESQRGGDCSGGAEGPSGTRVA